MEGGVDLGVTDERTDGQYDSNRWSLIVRSGRISNPLLSPQFGTTYLLNPRPFRLKIQKRE